MYFLVIHGVESTGLGSELLFATVYCQGWIQDFKIEGAQMMCSAHHKREAQNFGNFFNSGIVFKSAGVRRACLKAPEALRF